MGNSCKNQREATQDILPIKSTVDTTQSIDDKQNETTEKEIITQKTNTAQTTDVNQNEKKGLKIEEIVHENRQYYYIKSLFDQKY